MTMHEALIVGAGPIGLELAVAFQRAGVDAIQIEAGAIGQTITWYPRQARFFSSPERIAIAGVPLVTTDQSKASREEYLAYLRGIVEQFDLDIRAGERVTDLTRDADGVFTVITTAAGGPAGYRARRVILTIGDMAFPMELGIPGESLPHVTHYFDEPHPYFRRRLLVVGGRNSAVEAAIRCHRAGARVTISYRGAEFPKESVKYWLLPEIEGFIRQGHIEFLPGTEAVEIRPTEAVLRHRGTGGLTTHPADFVLLMTGYRADLSLFRQAGVTLEGDNESPRHNPETMETDVPGLYVAGTAAAGTQRRFRLFIENCHVHVDRIVAHVTGRPVAPRITRGFSLPES